MTSRHGVVKLPVRLTLGPVDEGVSTDFRVVPVARVRFIPE